MTTTTTFDYEVSQKGLGYNGPQAMGRRLWAPMFAMALLGFAVGFVLAVVRASEIASSGDPETIVRLGQLIPAFMFVGFVGVFAAISFAIARILGVFRKGGGEIQEAAGQPVHTLRMPVTAKVFLASMMMAAMIIMVAIVLHFVVAANAGTWSPESIEQWAINLEGARRVGVSLFLFGIAFGLGTIVTVLRFQGVRIRELAATHG